MVPEPFLTSGQNFEFAGKNKEAVNHGHGRRRRRQPEKVHFFLHLQKKIDRIK